MEPLKKGSINQKFLNRKILGRKKNQKSNINNIVSFELNADRSDSFLNSSQRMNVTRWWYLIARGVFSVDSGQLPAPLLPHRDGSPDKPAEKNKNSKVQLSWLGVVSNLAISAKYTRARKSPPARSRPENRRSLSVVSPPNFARALVFRSPHYHHRPN